MVELGAPDVFVPRLTSYFCRQCVYHAFHGTSSGKQVSLLGVSVSISALFWSPSSARARSFLLGTVIEAVASCRIHCHRWCESLSQVASILTLLCVGPAVPLGAAKEFRFILEAIGSRSKSGPAEDDVASHGLNSEAGGMPNGPTVTTPLICSAVAIGKFLRSGSCSQYGRCTKLDVGTDRRTFLGRILLLRGVVRCA